MIFTLESLQLTTYWQSKSHNQITDNYLLSSLRCQEEKENENSFQPDPTNSDTIALLNPSALTDWLQLIVIFALMCGVLMKH